VRVSLAAVLRSEIFLFELCLVVIRDPVAFWFIDRFGFGVTGLAAWRWNIFIAFAAIPGQTFDFEFIIVSVEEPYIVFR
jgi:hypothetical protein